MDFKNKIEIKEEPFGNTEEDINNGQAFEKELEFKEIQKKMVLPNILFINEIKDEPFDVEEEETENNQYVEDVEEEEDREKSHQHLAQISGLHESEIQSSRMFMSAKMSRKRKCIDFEEADQFRI
ncbi:hypothetical protein Anas_09156, partial [Armadillidium nasatum]